MKPLFLSVLIFQALWLVVSSTGCSAPVPQGPDTFEAVILIPASMEPERFIPAETALPVTVRAMFSSQQPGEFFLIVRVRDTATGHEYFRRIWPLPEITGGLIDMTRLLRMTGLPGSRHITVQAGIRNSAGSMLPVGRTASDIWYTLVAGYALYNPLAWSAGWYLPESTDRFIRGCNGHGVLHLSRPPFPEVLKMTGTAPVHCFDDHQWNLSFNVNTSPILQQTVKQDAFSAAITIDPYVSGSQCDSADWPVGEMEIVVSSDKTFDPSTCHGVDDTRLLAFHVTQMEKGDFVPVRGFYGSRETDDSFWPAPNATVLLPEPLTESVLYVQGRREPLCMEMPQSVTLTLAGDNLGSFMIDTDTFFIAIPYTPKQTATGRAIELNLAVSPVFFRSACFDTDDARPYGIGIDDICFRNVH